MGTVPSPVRERKPLEPVQVTGRVLTGLGNSVADLFRGHAILEIEGEGGRLESYWCTLDVSPDGHVSGMRLQRFATGQRYELPANLDDCTCPDRTYRPERPGGCRHMVALRQALVNVAKGNPPPRNVSRRVERDEVYGPAEEGGAA